MKTQTEQPKPKKCVACEGSVSKLSPDQVREQLDTLQHWRLIAQGQRIRRDWKMKNFRSGMDFLNRVAELAEAQGHHPDLHLEGYREVSIVIWTHAVGGLTEHDFALAAKIDQLSG